MFRVYIYVISKYLCVVCVIVCVVVWVSCLVYCLCALDGLLVVYFVVVVRLLGWLCFVFVGFCRCLAVSLC